jgi:hypothetical protein
MVRNAGSGALARRRRRVGTEFFAQRCRPRLLAAGGRLGRKGQFNC